MPTAVTSRGAVRCSLGCLVWSRRATGSRWTSVASWLRAVACERCSPRQSSRRPISAARSSRAASGREPASRTFDRIHSRSRRSRAVQKLIERSLKQRCVDSAGADLAVGLFQLGDGEGGAGLEAGDPAHDVLVGLAEVVGAAGEAALDQAGAGLDEAEVAGGQLGAAGGARALPSVIALGGD